MSEQGLLALIADALAEPWDAAKTPIPESKRLNRFLRLAMFASELMDDRAHDSDQRTSTVVPFDEETFSAEMLLGVGRLREADALTALVRAHDLYAEILPETYAEAQEVFESRVGISLADWITNVSLLAQSFFRELRPDSRWAATLNLASVNTSGNVERFRKIVRRLSRDREAFRDRYASIDSRKVNRGLAFQPIRETPFLHLPDRGAEFYAILHADFVLAAADDGVYFAIHDALPVTKRASFRSAFGKAFELYVERVLLRCAACISESSVVRIREGTGSEEPKRCDFAWRCGDQLILIDAKRVGFSAFMLMGGEGIRERYASDLINGFEQLITTAEDIERLGVEKVIPELRAPADWRPSRIFGVIAHHRPIFLWFDSAKKLLRDASLPERWKDEALAKRWKNSRLEERWDASFAAQPHAFGASELELLEAVLPSFPLDRILDAWASDDVRSYLGLDIFLESSGWQGLVASPYAQQKARALLARA